MRFVPAMLWAALIFYLSSRPHLPNWMAAVGGTDKLVHAGAYAVLCAWLLWGARGPRRGAAMGWCAAAASVYGISDELHQGFVPGRTPDVWDWLADTCGAVLCVWVWRRFGPQMARAWRRQAPKPQTRP